MKALASLPYLIAIHFFNLGECLSHLINVRNLVLLIGGILRNPTLFLIIFKRKYVILI